jgi:excisionase family DNA binding protein
MNALLDAALGYAAWGIPVYPAHWPRPTPSEATLACSCPRGRSCDRPAKHPLVHHGIHDATTQPGQLERWWSRWPAANVGLATGVIFDALDIDGPAGLAALQQLARAANLQLPGPLVRTGGGGWHHWFAPTGLGNRPPRGLAHVDWRGRGGCVLAPPSRHASGRRYRWLRSLEQAPLAAVPAALRALLDPDRPTTTRPTVPARPAAPGHPYGRRVLAAELAALGRATPGARNHTLNACAFKVYRYVASGLLNDQDVTAAFTQAARAIGLDPAETARTPKWRRSDGQTPVRCFTSRRRGEVTMDQLLSPQEVADRLGTSLRFVRRLVLERRIPFIKVGRHVRIATSDLDAFIAAGRVEAGSLPSSSRRRTA